MNARISGGRADGALVSPMLEAHVLERLLLFRCMTLVDVKEKQLSGNQWRALLMSSNYFRARR